MPSRPAISSASSRNQSRTSIPASRKWLATVAGVAAADEVDGEAAGDVVEEAMAEVEAATAVRIPSLSTATTVVGRRSCFPSRSTQPLDPY